METMRAIGFDRHLPITENRSLLDITVPVPTMKPHDLLVKVAAVSVNPADVWDRGASEELLDESKIIGWDAVGVVVDHGSDVTLFKTGERVFYAGSFIRQGSDAQYQVVDERIVGHAPTSLADDAAAAMPLTSLTAYEALFEQLQIPFDSDKPVAANHNKTILIINGAGGVGSVATQLAKLAGLKVIATASRPETTDWTKAHGTDCVVNHRLDLITEVRKLGIQYVDYILGLNDIDGHWDEMCELIKPGGRMASVTENHEPINLRKMSRKRGTFAWEWMFSKSYYQTADMVTQHEILDRVAQLIDTNELVSTKTKTLSQINAENLKKAHQMVEQGHMIGKVVLQGWPNN